MAAARPIAGPAASPRTTASNSQTTTPMARSGGSNPLRIPSASGRARIATAPPPTAPSSPPIWGSAPERYPSTTATTRRTIAPASNRFTARSSHTARGGAASADGDGDPRCRTLARDDGIRARFEIAKVDRGDLEHRDVDAGDVAPARSLANGDRDRPCRLRDRDRIEDAARLHAAPPARVQHNVAAADLRRQLLDRDVVDV